MRLTERKEDFFTEVLAASLNADERLARKFVQALLGDSGGARHSARVTALTQWNYKRPVDPAVTSALERSRVDLVVSIDDVTRIWIENKLFSPEGDDQLGKYLRSDLNYLAFITGYDARVRDEVWQDGRYLRPRTGRRHFTWMDLHQVVDAAARRPGAHLYVLGLRSLFRHLGFEPADDEFGDPQDIDPTRRAAARENYRRAWAMATWPALASAGWRKISQGSVAELYAADGPSPNVEKFWLDPNWQQGAIRMRLYSREGVARAQLSERVRGEIEVVETSTEPGAAGESKRAVIDIRLAVNLLFADAGSAREKAERMREFTFAVLRVVDEEEAEAT